MKIWVLVDYKVGTANQAVALADAIGMKYEIKNVAYNIFSKLPNLLLQFIPLHVTHDTITSFAKEKPDLIISAGRRTAPLALYLKRNSKRKIKVVQIMKPNCDLNQFDLVILPQHDRYDNKSATSNIIRTVGALCMLNVANQIDQGILVYPNIANSVAVVIGGNTKNYTLSDTDALVFVSILNQINSSSKVNFCISFSRRTPSYVKHIIQQTFSDAGHMIYDPTTNCDVNPYYAMLYKASHVISTPDSISMCSEAASTGKPLYIFSPENFMLKKHKFFIQQLFDLGIARKLDQSTKILENYKYKPLKEATRIANIVKSRLYT